MSFISIKEYVEKRKRELKEKFDSLPKKPTLYIFQAGDNAASNAYIKGKIKDGEELGVKTVLIKTKDLEGLSGYYANYKQFLRDSIHTFRVQAGMINETYGIIVQLPLPEWTKVTERQVKEMISPSMDVDGFNPKSKTIPCTPLGILNYLKANKYPFEDSNAVVIGRSDIVGKPMAHLLLKENCNVTVLHSHTSEKNMFDYIANADLIIAAAGKRNLLNKKFTYKENAVIIDVGINRDEANKLCGDCERDLPVLYQSPVPGGVGLLTRLALFENLYALAKEREDKYGKGRVFD